MTPDELSWQYIAGLVDGEGCFGICQYINSKTNKGKRAVVRVSQAAKNSYVLNLISEKLNNENINHSFYIDSWKKEWEYNSSHMAILQLAAKESIKFFINKILPFLIVKRIDAIKVLDFCEGNYDTYQI